MEKKSILVTGGCGFIASNFINSFNQRFPEINIVNLDKLDYCSNINNVNKGSAKLVKGNIQNRELLVNLIEEYKFDTVFHFAAHSHVDNSFETPLVFTMENAYGTHVLIDTFREHLPNVEFIQQDWTNESKLILPSIDFSTIVLILKPTSPDIDGYQRGFLDASYHMMDFFNNKISWF